ncbi:hypothetical protein [Endomicrobium proavitum]|uniref:Peptidase C39-like domain-containing protein n=1 Tax=Endomicrobium proavitum TaxID=1408281 RepID=A0A0G3WKW7_9BACT|nr:hypothetical protein [Endomicrobium proavitum]AKL98520.1 conserved exported protein of unknown function [Endomicrobium proavitum]
MKNKVLLLILFFCAITFCSCGGAVKKPLRCNLDAIAELKDRNISLPNKSANEIDNYLKTSPVWKLIARMKGKLDHGAAYIAAKSRKAIVVTYNSHSARSGHVAVVSGKKQMAYSNSFKAQVPYAWGSVNGEDPQLTLLSLQFAADKEPQMNYYVYVGE